MAQYYVKVNGGTGSGLDDANAWSYSKFNSTTLTAGDIVYFKKGEVFQGPLNIQSGSAGNPITYTTINGFGTGANPVISGFTTATSWANQVGNIWYVTLGVQRVQSVSVDGTIRGMGRYPNTGYLNFTGTNGTITPFVPATNISGTAIGSIPFDPTGGEVVIRKYRWVLDRHDITSRSGNTLNFVNSNFFGSSDAYPTITGNGFFIQNHIGALDQDGEWAYDRNTNRFYMYFSGSPSSRNVRISTVDILISANNRSYVNITGLDFDGSNYAVFLNNSSYITFTDCNFTKQGKNAIVTTTCTNITVTGGTVVDCLNTGILFEQSNNCTANGIALTNTGLIAGMGQSADSAYIPIRAVGNGSIISNNRIINSGYTPIYFIGNDVLVEKNFIDTHGLTVDDSGGIYTYGLEGATYTNRIIRRNIVLNGIGALAGTEGDPNGEMFGKSCGIYLDDRSSGVEVSNNFVANTPWGGIFLHNSFNNTILNNITYNVEYGLHFIIDNSNALTRNNTVSNNKFIARSPSQKTLGIEIHNFADNPTSFGTFNNNYYARPIDDNITISIFRSYNGTLQNLSLDQWKTSYSQDANSSKSLVTTNSVSNLRYDFNYSNSSAVIALSGVYKDIVNNTYNNSRTLGAYSGDVSIYTGVYTPSTPSKILVTPDGKILVYSGKVLVSG